MSDNPKVVITGANSFTYSYLKDVFVKHGYDVFALTRGASDDRQTYSVDFEDKEGLKETLKLINPDHFVDLAGVSFVGHKNIEEFYKANIIGKDILLESLSESVPNLTSFVAMSSATIYGTQRYTELSEDMTPNPVNHYGISKLGLEQICKKWMEHIPIVILRPFNYTGKGQSDRFLVPKIVSHFQANLPRIQLGNLFPRREYLDVRDVAQMIFLSALNDKCIGQTLNLSLGRSISIEEILDSCAELTGHSMEVLQNPEFIRKNEIPVLTGSILRRKRLGVDFIPRDFKDTLKWMLDKN